LLILGTVMTVVGLQPCRMASADEADAEPVPQLREKDNQVAAPDTPRTSQDPQTVARKGRAEYSIAALREHFARAVAGDKRTFTIPPGIYRGRVDENVFLTLKNAKDLTLNAEGVTLVCEKLTRAMQISNCEDLTLRGLTVDYDPVPFTHGTIVAVDQDDTWVDVKIHDGYPMKPYARIDIVDRKTRHRKYGMPFLWGTKAELRPEGVVRVMRKGGFQGSAAVGDLASMSTGQEAGGICHGIAIEHCTRVTLKDVTLHAAPGFGIINGQGYGDHHYDKVRVVPGPRPSGATEDRLLTTSWDAIQFNNLRKGPTLENCVVMAAGDDSWSLSSRDYLLLASRGRKAWVVNRVRHNNPLELGDRLARSLDRPKPKIVRMTKATVDQCPISPELRSKIESAKAWTYYNFKLVNVREIELDMECPWEPGTSLYSPDRTCSGFVLRNNTFHSSGRAGLINGASDGLIEGNTYIDVHAALSLYPNIPGGGGTGTENIVFRNNTIRGTGHYCPSPWSLSGGAISIHHGDRDGAPAPEGVFRKIVIENNTFENVRGPVFVVTSVGGLRISGNRFVRCQQQPHLGSGRSKGVDGEAIGWFRNCMNATVTANTVEDRGPYGKRGFVGLSESAEVEPLQ
jgi:hypothetical protein